MQELINSSDLKRKCIYWLVFRRYPSSLQSWSRDQPWTERDQSKTEILPANRNAMVQNVQLQQSLV